MTQALPSGTVTLLFTDIEGSTRLLEELGDRYSDVLAEHRRLLRQAFQAHGGIEVDTQGDAFFYAFASAKDALAAAAEAQQALLDGPVRVRIGLHTGEPIATDEGYVGIDVHRAARIMGVGHGGQVLLSQTTRELLDSSFELRDLGEHRLKDIQGPVWIFQLGRDPFPPLKTISNTNLPRPASSFIGRDRELEEVVALLRNGSMRMVTLTGPGGSGKTRLAIEAGAELVGDYPNGVFWVGLAALRDPLLVTETIAETLGAKDGLAEHISERELLLLVDNFEQLVDAAPQLSALLESCPNLALLVTSRELLRVQGEVEYAVPPLAEPEAVSLFCERAQTSPSAEISELCRRLDSLPLAVELAAARTKALSPAQILDRLSQRLDLLKGRRDSDPRQQTLRTTIEWSYDLLSESEQALFRRLSVFAGGCALAAAEDVAGADVDDLQSLVEKNLLRFSNERYWMLETIREYAAERLMASRELEDAKDRHAEFVLTLASQVETTLASQAAHDGLLLEEDNFRAALAWAEDAGQTDVQLGLIGRSWTFWWYRGHPAEGLRWVESALARSEGERSLRRASVLNAGAMFAHRHCDWLALKTYAEESLGIARELDDTRSTIWPLIFLGLWAGDVGEYDEATKFFEQAIRVARETGDRGLVGAATNNLGVVAMVNGDFVRGAKLFEGALAISRELGTRDEVSLETINLAWCFYEIGQAHKAAKAAEDGLSLALETDNLPSLEGGLVLLAALAGRQGNADVGARLIGTVEMLRDRLGGSADPELDPDLERTVAELQEALGEEEYTKAFAEGQTMSASEAVEYALASVTT
jgi:predicted ATPase